MRVKAWTWWKEAKDIWETVVLAIAAATTIAVIVVAFTIAFVSAIRSLPLAWHLALIAAFAILTLVLLRIAFKVIPLLPFRWNPFRKGADTPENPVAVDQTSVALGAISQEQLDSMETLIKIGALDGGSFADGRHLNEDNPYILFNFVVTNLSMYDVEVVGVTGHVGYRLDQAIGEFKDAPELPSKPTWSYKAYQRPLRLKQWVLPAVANFFLTSIQGDDKYMFEFQNLTIIAKVKLADIDVHRLRLPLPMQQTAFPGIRGVTP